MTDQTIARFVRRDCNCAVESGTFHGETTRLLASFPNFEEIHTVELAPPLYEAARARFDADGRIHCWLGDSGERFEEIFRELERYVRDPRVLVYCDGHYSGGETARGAVASPLHAELETLVRYRHLVKAVLIDDI